MLVTGYDGFIAFATYVSQFRGVITRGAPIISSSLIRSTINLSARSDRASDSQ